MISSGGASFLCVCLISSFVASAGAPAQQGAVVTNPRAYASSIPPIRDMKLLTDTSGWILAGQKILWTETAGLSWTDVTPRLLNGQALDSAYFFDTDHGWAVLRTLPTESAPAGITVAATNDQGKSWSIADLSSDEYFRNGVGNVSHFSFADAAHGWIIFQKASGSAYSIGDLFTTQDGGNTWTALPRPPILGEIKFFPDSTGWLVGGVNSDELYKTTDGGHSWVQKIIPLPQGMRPYSMPEGLGLTYVGHPQYLGPHFSNEADGIIEVLVPVKQVGDSRQLIYTTANGGETWTIQTKPEAQYSGIHAFFDSTWVGLTHSDAKLSIEGSSHSATFALPKGVLENSEIVKADLIDAEHGWLLTSRGELLSVSGASITVLNHAAPSFPRKPHVQFSPTTPQPLIGGTKNHFYRTRIRFLPDHPPQYVNSLYESYGQEITNGTYNVQRDDLHTAGRSESGEIRVCPDLWSWSALRS